MICGSEYQIPPHTAGQDPDGLRLAAAGIVCDLDGDGPAHAVHEGPHPDGGRLRWSGSTRLEWVLD